MCERWFACQLLSKAHSSGTVPRDADVTQVLALLFNSKPPQNRFAANPPGKQHVVGSTLDLLGYAGKAFLKNGALPWDKTKHVVRLLNPRRDLKLGINCETDGRVRIINMDLWTCANTGLHESFSQRHTRLKQRPEMQR